LHAVEEIINIAAINCTSVFILSPPNLIINNVILLKFINFVFIHKKIFIANIVPEINIMAKDFCKRAESYSQWYNDIVIKADLAENSAVRGCMVIKPYGYAIW